MSYGEPLLYGISIIRFVLSLIGISALVFRLLLSAFAFEYENDKHSRARLLT